VFLLASCVTEELLLPLKSSDGTDTVTVLVPSTVGVNPVKLTVVEAPEASDGIIWVLVNVFAPVIFNVTLRSVRVLMPSLDTLAEIVCGVPFGRGNLPNVYTSFTFASSLYLRIRRIAGRKAEAVREVVPDIAVVPLYLLVELTVELVLLPLAVTYINPE